MELKKYLVEYQVEADETLPEKNIITVNKGETLLHALKRYVFDEGSALNLNKAESYERSESVMILDYGIVK